MRIISAQYVCWHCRRAHVTLFAVKDEEGKKTNDYVCSDCRLSYPRPDIYNSSRVILKPKDKEDPIKSKNILDPRKLIYG